MYKIEELFSVSGKTVVVTGGGTGIAIATGFAENGASVYIVGRREEILQSAVVEIGKVTGQDNVRSLQGDIATKAGCNKIADELQRVEEKVDVVINCAGIAAGWRAQAHPNDCDAVERMLSLVEESDFTSTTSINVNGIFFVTVALLPLLRRSSDPSMIVISSLSGISNQRATGSLMYGVSKAAAIHMGKLLAGRLSPMKIRVNIICPGIFPSEMTGGQDMDPVAAKTAARTPMGRAGRPEEMVAPVILLSSRGGAYMTGDVMIVDGGRLLSVGIDDGIRLVEEIYMY